MGLLTVHILSAQGSLRDATGTWYTLGGNAEVKEQWSVPVLGILREYNLMEQAEFAFVQAGVRYTTVKKTTLGLGMAYLDTQPFEQNEFDSRTKQYWAYGEVSLPQGEHWSHRVRLEHRWIATPNENFINLRARYRLQYVWSISPSLYIKTHNETFFNFDEANIDQNRWFLGMGHRLAPGITVEAGYLKNHIKRSNFDRICVGLYFKTSFLKKEPLYAQHQK